MQAKYGLPQRKNRDWLLHGGNIVTWIHTKLGNLRMDQSEVSDHRVPKEVPLDGHVGKVTENRWTYTVVWFSRDWKTKSSNDLDQPGEKGWFLCSMAYKSSWVI